LGRIVASPIRILAIDDLRLFRMQNQLADRKAIRKRAPKGPPSSLVQLRTVQLELYS
jgi:hypothetical protein